MINYKYYVKKGGSEMISKNVDLEKYEKNRRVEYINHRDRRIRKISIIIG